MVALSSPTRSESLPSSPISPPHHPRTGMAFFPFLTPHGSRDNLHLPSSNSPITLSHSNSHSNNQSPFSVSISDSPTKSATASPSTSPFSSPSPSYATNYKKTQSQMLLKKKPSLPRRFRRDIWTRIELEIMRRRGSSEVGSVGAGSLGAGSGSLSIGGGEGGGEDTSMSMSMSGLEDDVSEEILIHDYAYNSYISYCRTATTNSTATNSTATATKLKISTADIYLSQTHSHGHGHTHTHTHKRDISSSSSATPVLDGGSPTSTTASSSSSIPDSPFPYSPESSLGHGNGGGGVHPYSHAALASNLGNLEDTTVEVEYPLWSRVVKAMGDEKIHRHVQDPHAAVAAESQVSRPAHGHGMLLPLIATGPVFDAAALTPLSPYFAVPSTVKDRAMAVDGGLDLDPLNDEDSDDEGGDGAEIDSVLGLRLGLGLGGGLGLGLGVGLSGIGNDSGENMDLDLDRVVDEMIHTRSRSRQSRHLHLHTSDSILHNNLPTTDHNPSCRSSPQPQHPSEEHHHHHQQQHDHGDRDGDHDHDRYHVDDVVESPSLRVQVLTEGVIQGPSGSRPNLPVTAALNSASSPPSQLVPATSISTTTATTAVTVTVPNPQAKPFSQPIPRSRPPLRTPGIALGLGLGRARSESYNDVIDPFPFQYPGTATATGTGKPGNTLSRLKMKMRRPWSAGSDANPGGGMFSASTDSLATPAHQAHYQLAHQRSSSFSTKSAHTTTGGGPGGGGGGGGIWGWGGLRKNLSSSRLQTQAQTQTPAIPNKLRKERRLSMTRIFSGLGSRPPSAAANNPPSAGTSPVTAPATTSAVPTFPSTTAPPGTKISRVLLPNNTPAATQPALTLGTMVIRDGRLMGDSESLWRGTSPRGRPTQEKQPQQSPPQPQPQQQTDLNCEAFTNALTSSMMFGNGHGATRPRLPLPTTMTKSTLSPTKEGGFMPKEPKKIPTLPSTLRRQTPSPSGWSPGSGKAQNLSRNNSGSGSEERYAVAPSSAALEMTPYDLNRPEPPISPTPVQRIEPTPPPRQVPVPVPVPVSPPPPPVVVAEAPPPQPQQKQKQKHRQKQTATAPPPPPQEPEPAPVEHKKPITEKAIDRCLNIRKHLTYYEIWCFLDGYTWEGIRLATTKSSKSSKRILKVTASLSISQASLDDPNANLTKIHRVPGAASITLPPGLTLPTSPARGGDGELEKNWERKVSFGADVDLLQRDTINAEWDARNSILRITVKRTA